MKKTESIDMIATGRHLKKLFQEAHLRTVDIQRLTCLSYPQSIYRWYRGEVLPSVDHLYTFSRVLGMHMEDLLIPSVESSLHVTSDPKRRHSAPYRRLRRFQSLFSASAD